MHNATQEGNADDAENESNRFDNMTGMGSPTDKWAKSKNLQEPDEDGRHSAVYDFIVIQDHLGEVHKF